MPLAEALNRPESPLGPPVSAAVEVEVEAAVAVAVAVADRVSEATGLGDAMFLLDLHHLAMNGATCPG
ncbi:hypothetical protein AQJ58_07560 [Streptomyces sp. DSM 15324]|nr:hypothetical protein AQJ58_07560 [Streptomyces sp. DSM 15324]